jgi:hypothetical protein
MTSFHYTDDYAFRRTDDHRTELVCMYCYATVITTANKDELAKAKAGHLCHAKSQYRHAS